MKTSSVEKLIDAAEALPFGFMVISADDQNASILYVNNKLCRLCGYASQTDLMAKTEGHLSALIDENDYKFFVTRLAEKENHEDEHLFYRMIHRNGQLINVEDKGSFMNDEKYGRVMLLYVTQTNEAQNHNVFDRVTGLYERAYLMDWIRRSRKYNPHYLPDDQLSIIAFNISGFKNYNESAGFAAGNAFLKKFASLLVRTFNTDIVERVYADHFAVFYNGTDTVEKVERVCSLAKQIQSSVPMRVEAGIYQWDEDKDDNLDEGVERAETACKAAHSHLGSSYSFYTKELADAIQMNLYVQSHIDEALEKGWIKLYLQPVVRTLTGKVCGFEALSRWDDPTYGMISPSVFVPALEEKYLSYKLAEFVIDETAHIIARQQEATGVSSVPISLNLSRRDFSFIDPTASLEKAINKYHINQSQICIEITESTAMENPDQVRNIIGRLHNIRYAVWMDDFGSSYSSLNALKDFDFDEIKLDMAFMRDLNEKGRVIVESCVNMAKKMGIQTLCEGVETKEQFEFLKEIGCEKIQGFYYSKPLPVPRLDAYLKREGLSVEADGERLLYGKMTRFIFDPQQAWFLSLCRQDDIHILLKNKKLLEGAKKCEVSDDFQLNSLSRYGSHMGPKLYKAINQAIKTQQEEEVTYFANKTCYLIRSQMLASHDNHFIVLTTVKNITGDLGTFSLAAADPIVQSIIAMYDCIYMIDYKAETVNVITSDFIAQKAGKVYHLDISKVMSQFADLEGQRFSEWISKERVLHYFSYSNHIYDSRLFTIHTPKGNVLKDFILLRMNGAEKSQFLLVMRDVHIGTRMVGDKAYTYDDGELSTDFQKGVKNLRLSPYREKIYQISDALKTEILYGMTNIFVAVLEIDVTTWRVIPVVLPDVVLSYMSGDNLDYREVLADFIKNSVSEPYQQDILDFTNPDTVVKRLTVSGVLAKTFVGVKLGWIRMALIPSLKDKEGRVTRFLFTTRDVNAENNQKQYMNYLIEHDHLTKIFNRSGYQRLSVQLKEADEAVWLMMVDVNDFKKYNDTYGHETGDAILRNVAKALEDNFRAADYVIRMGGDEFAVIMVDCPLDFSADVLKRKVKQINNWLKHEKDHLPAVSISAGMAISPRGFKDELYREADAALYEAKRSHHTHCVVRYLKNEN